MGSSAKYQSPLPVMPPSSCCSRNSCLLNFLPSTHGSPTLVLSSLTLAGSLGNKSVGAGPRSSARRDGTFCCLNEGTCFEAKLRHTKSSSQTCTSRDLFWGLKYSSIMIRDVQKIALESHTVLQLGGMEALNVASLLQQKLSGHQAITEYVQKPSLILASLIAKQHRQQPSFITPTWDRGASYAHFMQEGNAETNGCLDCRQDHESDAHFQSNTLITGQSCPPYNYRIKDLKAARS